MRVSGWMGGLDGWLLKWLGGTRNVPVDAPLFPSPFHCTPSPTESFPHFQVPHQALWSQYRHPIDLL